MSSISPFLPRASISFVNPDREKSPRQKSPLCPTGEIRVAFLRPSFRGNLGDGCYFLIQQQLDTNYFIGLSIILGGRSCGACLEILIFQPYLLCELLPATILATQEPVSPRYLTSSAPEHLNPFTAIWENSSHDFILGTALIF